VLPKSTICAGASLVGPFLQDRRRTQGTQAAQRAVAAKFLPFAGRVSFDGLDDREESLSDRGFARKGFCSYRCAPRRCDFEQIVQRPQGMVFIRQVSRQRGDFPESIFRDFHL
jgi:hypothetical protein